MDIKSIKMAALLSVSIENIAKIKSYPGFAARLAEYWRLESMAHYRSSIPTHLSAQVMTAEVFGLMESIDEDYTVFEGPNISVRKLIGLYVLEIFFSPLAKSPQKI